MTFPDYLYLAVVLLVGVPAAVRVAGGRLYLGNATAAALVASYVAAQGLWLATGLAFEARISLLIDLTVIAAIYCKAPAHDCWPYQDWGHQLCAAWFERSLWDRIVIVIFPAMWLVYLSPLSPNAAFYGLYWLAIAQFLAAGGEALQPYLNARSAKAGSAPDSSAGLEFSWSRGRERYGGC